jgi:uncharacterized membrane protein|tara:strand:- start:427 stop:900 length:474 start_codon:yes stop_codon:yes gene_type:complete
MIEYSNYNFDRFIIKPNQSISAGGLKIFFILIFSVSFIIAIFFALNGIWIIMPFTGFEMLFLALALSYCYLKRKQYEIISITDSKVSILSRFHRGKKEYNMERYWTRVVLDKPCHKGHPHKLFLRSHGKQTEIGALLNDDERLKLAKLLKGKIPYGN